MFWNLPSFNFSQWPHVGTSSWEEGLTESSAPMPKPAEVIKSIRLCSSWIPALLGCPATVSHPSGSSATTFSTGTPPLLTQGADGSFLRAALVPDPDLTTSRYCHHSLLIWLPHYTVNSLKAGCVSSNCYP